MCSVRLTCCDGDDEGDPHGADQVVDDQSGYRHLAALQRTVAAADLRERDVAEDHPRAPMPTSADAGEAMASSG